MLIDAHLVLIPVLLVVAAIFAAAEAALFSLRRSQLETLKETRPLAYSRIRRLLFRPQALLSTIIIGNECVNIMVGTFVVALVQKNFPFNEQTHGVISVFLSCFLLLSCSEILPKVLAFRLPVITASILVFPLGWAHALLTPFRKLFLFLSERILKAVGVAPRPPEVVSEKDFLMLVEAGAESGSLDKEEHERIVNVFHFSDLKVSSILTGWAQVTWVRDDLTVEQALHEIKHRAFSRVPVFSVKEQKVMGILYTKELLKLRVAALPREAPLREVVEPPYVVSSHAKVARLFREFRLKKVHIALVVDEYGRHVGIVTLEDVLNSLFRTSHKKKEGVAVA